MWNWGERVELEACLYTNAGGRDYNEDSADCRIDGGGGVFLLADGLGGHKGGEQASGLVVEAMLSAWDAEGETLDAPDCRQWLEDRVAEANQALLSAQKEHHNSMKSTVVALALKEGRAAWVHVGDSRLYYISGSRLCSVTRDHSVTYKKYLAGEISREQINFDEDRSSLLRVVGDETRCIPESGEPDGGFVHQGDAFLLCSDGFWEYLFDEEILIDYLKAATPKAWAELMLVRALPRMRPGSDNLTLLTVFVS